LTDYGSETVAHAIGTIIESGIITNCVVHFVTNEWTCPAATFREVDDVDTRLRFMRERLLDWATLYYPWHPDD